MLLFGLLVVIGICKLLGGKFAYLAQLPLQKKGWLLVVIMAQLIGLGLLRQRVPWLAGGLLVASFVILIFISWSNRHMAGMPVVLVGIILNFMVISANGGAMPITTQTLAAINRSDQLPSQPALNNSNQTTVLNTKDVVSKNASLLFLGDVIVIPFPGRLATAMSLGDVLIGLGLVRWCFWAMKVPAPFPVRAVRWRLRQVQEK
jgi:hypothetical protein